MRGKCVVIDGPSGMVKSTLISALAARLEDDDISAVVCNDITLLDCLASGDPVKKVRKTLSNGQVCLASTTHIYELAQKFYKDGSKLNYSTLNNALAIAKEILGSDLLIVIDSLPRSQDKSEARRGYLWEAKQRGYEVLTSIGDVEPVFEKIAKIVSANKAAAEEPVPISKVLKAKKLPRKSRAKPNRKKS